MTSTAKRVFMDREVRSFHDLPSGGANMSPWRQFTAVVRLFYRNYFRTRGRATRAEFWWLVLFQALVAGAWTLAGRLLSIGGPHFVTNDTPELLTQTVMFVGMFPFAWQLVNLIPSITLPARRFHDTDSSSALLFTLIIPIAGLVIVLIYALTASDPRGVRYDPPGATAARPPA
ncbi:MAG: DUF805 domain-containing protein [Kocuria sp.]|nr:DUF805 domain-containing protein [Kocuria sp.]